MREIALFNQNAIKAQVLRNCSISDSRHAGLYSVCGLALRLRDLYKWEQGLDPWIETESSRLLQWIGEKEEEWEKLSELEFSRIEILGASYDPFDVDGINAALRPFGLFYGAGYVHSIRPTFFLAGLDGTREIGGYTVYFLGRELARDILTLPALSQGESILVRKESARVYLWDRIFFIRDSARPALRFALEHYGFRDHDPQWLRTNLSGISEAETEAYIHHELGELMETSFDRNTWQELVAAFPHTAIEFLARTVKDLLADTNQFGTLQYVMRKDRKGSLGFYVAFLDGLRKELFPQLAEAFNRFAETENWQLIEEAVSHGYETAKGYARSMTAIYLEGKEKCDITWARKEMERLLLAPLGIKREES